MSNIKSTKISSIPRKFTEFSMESCRSAYWQKPEKWIVDQGKWERKETSTSQGSLLLLKTLQCEPSLSLEPFQKWENTRLNFSTSPSCLYWSCYTWIQHCVVRRENSAGQQAGPVMVSPAGLLTLWQMSGSSHGLLVLQAQGGGINVINFFIPSFQLLAIVSDLCGYMSVQ